MMKLRSDDDDGLAEASPATDDDDLTNAYHERPAIVTLPATPWPDTTSRETLHPRPACR